MQNYIHLVERLELACKNKNFDEIYALINELGKAKNDMYTNVLDYHNKMIKMEGNINE